MERIRSWSPRKPMSLHLAIIAVVVILLFIIAIALILTMEGLQKLGKSDADRIECPGFKDEESCVKQKCLYEKVDFGPSCYMEKNSFGYQVESIAFENATLTAQLKNLATDTPYGPSLKNVEFKLIYLTENILRFQFKVTDDKRYEVPVQENFPLLKNPPGLNESNVTYEIIYSNKSDVFHFGVKRRGESSYLWDTRIGGLLLSDQFLQIASFLPTEYVYGLGEHVHPTLKHSMNFVTWPMFAKDAPAETNAKPNNLYGVHPFYTCLEGTSGKSHGVFFLNSNAMEATFMPAPAISFRTIGGILDFFIFVGDSPEHVVQLYTSLVGRPMIPPFWGLGFQLSRFGHQSIATLKEALNRTLRAQIPVAVQHLDIDHMNNSKDFTWDEETFTGLPDYIRSVKTAHKIKWITILDPAIAAIDNYEPYTSGLNNSVFVKRSGGWKPSMFPLDYEAINVTMGKVWPPYYSAFPDFFLDATKQWWKDNIVKHKKEIDFDGLWIDMNEPANFETNVENPKYCKGNTAPKECWSLICPEGTYDDPPYFVGKGRISNQTICMASVQGKTSAPFLHYNVHSLYGWSQTQPTLEATQAATGTRSLVISRSTYPSSGRYAGHWLGDNASTFEDMRKSIIGMLEFNLFGIPYIGADVCGFYEDATEELCKRWMQLGAFYPFYRNHNGRGQKDQDPGFFKPQTKEIFKAAIERRISLNPYLYTLFYRAHVDGNTVVRPVFHEFPGDKMTWTMETQFMWGKHIMITPILDEDRQSITKYMPKDEWWHFSLEKSRLEPITESYVIDPESDDSTPIHIRGGLVLPFGVFNSDKYPENYASAISLYIFPLNGTASGELFVDDGESIDTVENKKYALYTFSYTNCTLGIKSENEYSGTIPSLSTVVVFKVSGMVNATSGQTQFNATFFDTFNSVVITVETDLKTVTELSWKSEDGSCNMLP